MALIPPIIQRTMRRMVLPLTVIRKDMAAEASELKANPERSRVVMGVLGPTRAML